MRYLGSKRLLAKHILPIMLPYRQPGKYWVEPFVGGANMIDKVDGPRIGADINEYIIALLIAIRDGWVPPNDIKEDEYYFIRKYREFYSAHFVGFGCSFGGNFFGTYARSNKDENFATQSSNSLLRQAPKLAGVDFLVASYDALEIPKNSLIYCDPPYKSTTGYKDSIDHDRFWQWCRDKEGEGHTIFISEYSAPDDFKCVFEKDVKVNFTSSARKRSQPRVERLFTPSIF